MKKAKTRTSVSIWGSEKKEAERLVGNKKLRLVFPGMGNPTKKKILELAITLGLKEIDREIRR